jgi:hypothetical protein
VPQTVRSVLVLDHYRLRLSFADGFSGIVDLESRVGSGGVFDPLRALAYFRQVRVDHDIGSICWPNGADLCPDVLRREAKPDPTG